MVIGFDPITAGIGLISGIFGAFGAAEAQNAQIDYQNRLAIAQYKQAQQDRLARYMGDINIYNQAKLQFRQAQRDNIAALYSGAQENQQWLNDIKDKLDVDSMNRLVQVLEAQGNLQASNAAPGRSSARSARMIKSQAGQQQAMAQQSLVNAFSSAKLSNEKLMIAKRSADNRAWSEVAFAPDPGFEPMKPILQGGVAPNFAGALTGALGGFYKVK